MYFCIILYAGTPLLLALFEEFRDQGFLEIRFTYERKKRDPEIKRESQKRYCSLSVIKRN